MLGSLPRCYRPQQNQTKSDQIRQIPTKSSYIRPNLVKCESRISLLGGTNAMVQNLDIRFKKQDIELIKTDKYSATSKHGVFTSKVFTNI